MLMYTPVLQSFYKHLYNGHCIDSMEMGVLIIFQITAHLWPDFDQIFYL